MTEQLQNQWILRVKPLPTLPEVKILNKCKFEEAWQRHSQEKVLGVRSRFNQKNIENLHYRGRILKNACSFTQLCPRINSYFCISHENLNFV